MQYSGCFISLLKLTLSILNPPTYTCNNTYNLYSNWLLLTNCEHLTPDAQVVRRERVSQAHCDGSEEIANKEGFGTTIKDLPMSLKLLLKNPVYMMLNMAGVSEGIATSGFATFLPKFIQNQFGQSPGYAAILAGKQSERILALA